MRAKILATLTACLLPLPAASFAAELPADWPDQLTVYVIPPTRPMKWSSPRKLALRTITNQLVFWHRDFRHSIGHVFVHLKSSLAERDLMTGMTGRVSTEDRDLLLEDGYGLGVVGADMMGRLEDDEDLRRELEVRAQSGLIASMRFLISPEAGARLAQFLDEFRAQGLDDHYGGSNRPRYREGGGCSAFGVAFMELAGLMRSEFDGWQVDVRVPMRFYGGPLTGLRAPLRRVLTSGSRWATEDEPHIKLHLWDPGYMYEWIQRTHRQESQEPTGSWTIEQVESMRQLALDARELPVPAEPIWLEHPAEEPHPWGRQKSVRREISEDPPAGQEPPGPTPAELAFLRRHGEPVEGE